jgi:integrase/recombinase XerD
MLFDRHGNRKYMVEAEWRAFLTAADRADPETRAFCWTLLRTGARLTEARNLTARSFDAATGCVVIRCLKRRTLVYRDVPINGELFELVEATFGLTERRADPALIEQKLWPWSRSTAWGRIRRVGRDAGLPEFLCMPKALRHTFAIEGAAIQQVPIGIMKDMLGHARLESTLIYATPVGQMARSFSDKMFSGPPREAVSEPI